MGRGAKLCIVKKKGLCPQAPSFPPPIKIISCNSKKQSRGDKAEEVVEKEEAFSPLFGL